MAKPAAALLLASTLFGFSAVPILAQTASYDRISAAATGDWNQDGVSDLALLVWPDNEDEDKGIHIFLYSSEANKLVSHTIAPNKVWGDYQMAGRQPSISAAANGSIIVTSHNDSVGRDRWEQKLTLAFRNFDFVVAGYTYNSYDTLDPDNVTNCDFNVLTGKAERNGETLRVAPQMVSLANWTDEVGRNVCNP